MRRGMVPMVVMAVLFIGLYRFCSSFFEGQAVARLPFTPFQLAQSITHRGVEGDDARQCGFSFVYVVTSMVVRPVLAKLLGREAASGGPGLWQQAQTRMDAGAGRRR